MDSRAPNSWQFVGLSCSAQVKKEEKLLQLLLLQLLLLLLEAFKEERDK